jgi:hypothetical protein
MNEEDIWVMDGIRRDVDRDIKEMLADSDKGASIVEWWDILWFENDLTVTEIRKMRSLDKDGVHLNARANKCAAASLCDRFRVRMARWRSMTGQKKRKMDWEDVELVSRQEEGVEGASVREEKNCFYVAWKNSDIEER